MSSNFNKILGTDPFKFVYDGAGDLLKLIDGKNQTNIWNYDSFGRVTNKLDAAGNIVLVYKYDADSHLTNRWSAAKTNTFYLYDAVGNLTNILYPVSSNIVLQYDALNRLTNLVDAVGTTVYSYDQVGQLLSEVGPWTNDTVSYTYTNRLRTGLSLLQPGTSAWTESYGYDSTRRLNSLTSSAGTFGYTYDPVQLQRVVGLSLGDGANIANTYDGVARMTGTYLHDSGGALLDQYAYGYNLAGQRTNVVRTAGDHVNYAYDNIGELTTANGFEVTGASRWQEQLGYVYDAAGNLNQRNNNAIVQNFNVNKLNELTNVLRSGTFTVAGTTSSGATNVTVNTSNAVLFADHTFASTNQSLANGTNTFTAIAKDFLGNVATNIVGVNLPVTNTYSYDLNGNVLTNGTKIFAYDDENELKSVLVTSNWQSQFVYDGKFRRRIEKDFSWSGSTWVETNEIHFIYDRNVVIQERNTNNIQLVTYTRGNDLSGSLQGAGGIGGLLARTDTNSSTYYHADGNGNITMLIDVNQAVVAKYLYDPFGIILSQSGPLANVNVYRFSSKEWNANAGFYYFGWRYYDPTLQRWLNRDPIQEAGGINLYAYVMNNPINAIDALGTDATATTIEGFNLGSEAVAESGAAAWTVGINNSSGALSLYTSGWGGNQYVATASVGANAEVASGALTVVGIGYNVYQAYNGQESWIQAGANSTVSGTAWGIGYFAEDGGPIGLSLAGGYFAGSLINEYVPGVSENAQAFFQPFTDWYYGSDDPYLEPLFPLYVPPCNQ
jgi:RHS repeat-associated protein